MNQKTLKLVSQIPGWLSIHEGQFLLKSSKLVKKLKGEVVEIGSFQGKSAIWLAQENNLVYAIDPHEGNLDEMSVSPTLKAFRKHLKQAGVTSKVHELVQPSAEVAKTWNKKVKLLFIDGLHEEKYALKDYKDWSPFLVDGGIIAMHDAFCGWPGVGNVVLNKIINNPDYEEVGVVGSIIYAINGKAKNISVLNKWRSGQLIKLALKLQQTKALPEKIKFLLIHRIIKLLLLNRFTFRRH